jgi:hypothetical protein
MAINAAPYAPGASTANIQQRRLYPQFAGIEDEKTDGFSNYHSWQVWVRRQFHRGLSVTTAYTLSKNTGLAVLQSEGNANIRDINNMRLDKGLLQYDVTHALSTSFFWTRPENLWVTGGLRAETD